MLKRSWDILSWLFVILFGLVMGFVIGSYFVVPVVTP